MKRSAAASLLALLLAAPAQAQLYPPGTRIVHFLAGTGFFVNSDGYVLTNSHVVQNCTSLRLEGAVRAAPARVLAQDTENDLALLKTEVPVPAVGELRSGYFPVEQGEKVVTVGFPGQSGLTTREAEILDVTGPRGEEKWLQFSDTVRQGNSGGPLLDGGANVVGVVMAKSEVYRYHKEEDRKEIVRTSDIAIAMPVVKRFLDSQTVRYRESNSGGILQSHRVEERSRAFIVQVLCQQ